MAIENKLTFRERICRHLVDRFKAQTKDNANIVWDTVVRVTMNKTQQMSGNALGIYDTSERVSKEIGYDVRVLNVVLEFHIALSEWTTDESPSILNAALGEVQRVAGLDHQLSDPQPDNPLFKLAINCEEAGSEINIGSEKPVNVTGVLILRITYRTKSNNPFAR